MKRLTNNIIENRPTYPERIIQFGEGNFLRAFVDWQVEELNNRANFNSSVVIVQPREHGMIDKLTAQDCLYTVVLEGIQHGEKVQRKQLIQSVSRGINPYESYDAFLELAEQPTFRFITSNTTEAGIYFSADDVDPTTVPESFPGKLTALLYRRFQQEDNTGFIIIPCELIDRNGEVLKETVKQYAAHWSLGDDFVEWLDQENTFCCSLVDRIVPGFPHDSIVELTAELGYDDQLVVTGEPFHLWVIEGPESVAQEFPAAQIGLDTKVVTDLEPYRTRKVRVLNGLHTALTPVAYLMGLETVADAVADDELQQFVRTMAQAEIAPTIHLPEAELQAFIDAVFERFSNPFIKHYVMSIALNSLSKYTTRNLPTVLDYYAKEGTLPRNLAFSLAALLIFYRGKRGEEVIALADDAANIAFCAQAWRAYEDEEQTVEQVIKQLLGHTAFWKQDLNEIPGLTKQVSTDVITIMTHGMRAALEQVNQTK